MTRHVLSVPLFLPSIFPIPYVLVVFPPHEDYASQVIIYAQNAAFLIFD